MGGGGSIEQGHVAPPSIEYHTDIPASSVTTGTDAQARVIRSISSSDRVIQCTRVTMNSSHFAISHRWQNRAQCDVYTVQCDDEPPYTCELFPDEVVNLEQYVAKLGYVWLDYVCIDQSSDADKVAQVNIMGQIYANATSIVLGAGLHPTMPPRDYLKRAWCFQERMFGPIRFVWDMDAQDLDHLTEFAKDIALRVSGLSESISFIDRKYDYNEDWRIATLRKIPQKYPQTAALCNQMEHHIRDHRNDHSQRQIAITALRIRELVPCDHPIVTSEWNLFLFDCQASIEKDRLYGTWGVPMYQLNVPLSYDYPDATWHQIAKHFPEADYAFHAPHDAPDQPHGGFSGFGTVTQLMCHIMKYAPLRPGTHAKAPIGGTQYTMAHSSEVCGIVWDEAYVGIAWNKHPPIQTFHFIASKECIRRGKGVGGEAGPVKKYIRLIERLRKLGANIPHWTVTFELKAFLEKIADA
ncbi:hypothetical protein H310_04284 [Aphanomyces invadans]|uniref:Heterokaryon incompatibility domain-containing protein n=1 Tax=Aphanomyces invadans TaxID=157072 RepID=A0A024UG27_9STRA|nr:hypothetical protein H310_04284 [Aphanomyces invadans]ETW05346.1 hypothetical protein H310_04284 [Aphanomyces invadans]|eukprot:XP_008866784.1 hypothetical protein H310_04284 [Aphanomyces invadans]